MAATREQIIEQARAIERHAAAIAEGKVPEGTMFGASRHLLHNAETLVAWLSETED